MKKVFKWIGIVLAGLLGMLLLALVVLYILGSNRLDRSYDIQVEAISIPADGTAVDQGRHLAEAVTLCQACHGEDLEGAVIDDEPNIALISAPNLTSGQDGVASSYTDEDWVRAIRHGVNPEGRGLIIMHSDLYNNLSEQDLGAIIAYVKSVPAVENAVPATKAELLGRIFVALGMFDVEGMPLIPAEEIDHNAPFDMALPQDSTQEYGQYLLSITVCSMCHGSDYTGRPPLEPGTPPSPDITTGGRLNGISEQEFISLFRRRGAGQSDYMPWDVYANMTDEELTAIWLYLTSLNSE